jgi:anaerobic selenocysteine-containing dehydrogenase
MTARACSIPPQLVDDLARLESALAVTAARDGARRPAQLRTANSWTQNVHVSFNGQKLFDVRDATFKDAGRIGLLNGATATIRSAAGSIDVPVEITDVVMPGVVCVPYGWGHGLPGTRQGVATGHAGVNVNILTDASVVDPMSGNAVLNGIPVTVAPA